MKKVSFLIIFAVYGLVLNAQYEENYLFWNDMVNPDNQLFKNVKKEGFKSLKVVSHATNDEDDEQITANEITVLFDNTGRLANITYESNPAKPSYHYDYDRKGQVLRFTKKDKNTKEASFEFVYDRRKGYKYIRSTDTLFQWDTIKSRLVIATDTNTRYYYFHKSGMPEKYIKTYTNVGINKVVYKYDSVFYKYDRNDNLIEYYKVQTNSQGIVTIEETGTYTYDIKKNLLKVVINKLDYDFNEEQPRKTIEYNFTYEGDMIAVLQGYSKLEKEYYYDDGSLMNENSFVDVLYTYAPSGLPMNYTKRITPPGQDIIYVYSYLK